MEEGEVIIPKTWRSEFPRLVLFVITAIGCVVLSGKFERSIISGEIVSFGDSKLVMSLPLFWLLPAIVLGSAILRIYNVRYCMDSRGIESRTGVLSMNQVITRIRFEDIRSIDVEQTIWERLLDIGIVEMGTAAQAGLEMVFEGVAAPKEIQSLIQRERDAREAIAANGESFEQRMTA